MTCRLFERLDALDRFVELAEECPAHYVDRLSIDSICRAGKVFPRRFVTVFVGGLVEPRQMKSYPINETHAVGWKLIDLFPGFDDLVEAMRIDVIGAIPSNFEFAPASCIFHERLKRLCNLARTIQQFRHLRLEPEIQAQPLAILQAFVKTHPGHRGAIGESSREQSYECRDDWLEVLGDIIG